MGRMGLRGRIGHIGAAEAKRDLNTIALAEGFGIIGFSFSILI